MVKSRREGASGQRTGRIRRCTGYVIAAAPSTAATANGYRKTWVKKSTTSTAASVASVLREGTSTARSARPAAIAKRPSAATKLMKPQCVRCPHANGTPSIPRSGDLRIPHARVARPAGKRSSMIPVASLTAVVAEKTSIRTAPST
jgi:hypothetical protein